MKKIVAILCAAILVVSLASCAKQAQEYEIKVNRIKEIHLTKYPDMEASDIDTEAFAQAYNDADVGKVVDSDAASGEDVILFTIVNQDPVAVYYMGGNKFIVTGNSIDEPYSIRSDELAELYNDTCDQ